jgi:hypothetical protein
VEVTFVRALKIWWSFAWRALVLWLPVGLLMAISMHWLLPLPHPGQPNVPLSPSQVPGFMARGMILWVVLMCVAIVAQTVAIRWMLKVRWSDFRLQAVMEDVT